MGQEGYLARSPRDREIIDSILAGEILDSVDLGMLPGLRRSVHLEISTGF